jgi:uncharacterized protein (TIGR02145 family)
MKKFSIRLAFVSLFAVVAFCSCNKDGKNGDGATPPLAASTKTWTIESPDGKIKQMWSDHINVPACNKSDYNGGTSDEYKADCRSYNYEGTTHYYYSWQYVNENQHTLCPDPWRVPTRDDFRNYGRAHSGNAYGEIIVYSKQQYDNLRLIGGWTHIGIVTANTPYGFEWAEENGHHYWSASSETSKKWAFIVTWLPLMYEPNGGCGVLTAPANTGRGVRCVR